MNLSKLFEMQKELDAKIIKEHGLEDMDRLPYLILALQVELGECANEWRGFKYWSKDQEPRTEKVVQVPFEEADWSGLKWVTLNPLLEEYVDCLHFILSIGLVFGFESDKEYLPADFPDETTIQKFTECFVCITQLINAQSRMQYTALVRTFLDLGNALGFTWEQVENAYMDKNAVNHKRQETGY